MSIMTSRWLRREMITTPDPKILEGIKEAGLDPVPVKRGRGRPKGSKNKKPMQKSAFYDVKDLAIDPNTGIVVSKSGKSAVPLGRIGDEKVSAFVQYHIDMLQMRQGCNQKDVPDMYNRFYRYLAYCAEHGIMPNNMNAYFAIGVPRQRIFEWKNGSSGTPEHRRFAEDITQFFASIHEQAGAENIVNPILSIYWSKAHDGMSDQPKIEVQVSDPLGEKRSATDIARDYGDLPDD